MNNHAKKQILIIEDDPIFLEMLKLRLEINDYDVIATEDGINGLALAKTKIPDLIIMDLELPQGDDGENFDNMRMDQSGGHKICRMIKFDKTLKDIPVLILTCSDEESDISLSKKCGADAYLLKTKEMGKILETIQRLLKKSRMKIIKLGV